MGFQTSFLEHLCERKLYKRNDKTKRFNEIYITQLVRNYRSHPSILKLSNELFYDNSLIPMASEGKRNYNKYKFKHCLKYKFKHLSNISIELTRCNWMVCEFPIVAVQTIPNHFQVRSILQCRTIGSEQKVKINLFSLHRI